jgi:hypothetical protein
MDHHRNDRIQNHFEMCLQQAGVFERSIDGSQLFDINILQKSRGNWLVLAAGISDTEASDWFADSHTRERTAVPIQISPRGQLSLLLILRPLGTAETLMPGKYITEFSSDVGSVELRQGCYIRVSDLVHPAVQQVRWELDAVTGHKEPKEEWLRPWFGVVGINPAHAPSHWHINSPPIEINRGRRKPRQTSVPPELRLAVGLPNPLALMLSIGNWLRCIY